MTPNWSRWVLTLTYGACVLCACADAPKQAPTSESVIYQGDGPYPVIPQEQFAEAWGRARTALLDKCCEYVGGITTQRDHRLPVPSAHSHAVYDAAAGSACIAQQNMLECQHGKDLPRRSSACDAAYHDGQLQLGEACQTNWECKQTAADPLVCKARFDGSASLRTCQPPDPALPRTGEPCLTAAASGERCELPLTCRADGRCGLPQLGETCVTGAVWPDTCAKGLVCDRDRSKRCIEPLAPGSACESGEQCELYACIDGMCAEPVWGLNTCLMAE